MDISTLLVDYLATDFAGAIRKLLPNGEYWQQNENAELNALINAIGEEFKTVHDECQLNLLTEIREEVFGWRISDYQELLYLYTKGKVFDEITTPNLIYVQLEKNLRSEKALYNFEEKRLPHTAILWLYTSATDLHIQASNARYIFNQHKHKVTL